jgi:ketoreductase
MPVEDIVAHTPRTPGTRPLALVTGGGRGIGREIALELALRGYDLELTALDAAEARRTHELLAALREPPAARTAVFDLHDRAATATWALGLRTRESVLEVLVHNAGVGGPDPASDELALAHLETVLDLNAGAVLRVTREALSLIPTDGSGRIVIVASILGRMGVAGFAAYCSSKAAVIGLGRAMARDLAKKKITVNMICPGWTDTAMAQQGFEAIAAATGTTPDEARKNVEAGLPLGRIVRPAEVAQLVAFLASPGAAAMTGQTINMCAGDLQR